MSSGAFPLSIALLVLVGAGLARADVHAVVEVQSGYLLGASTDGKWIDAIKAAKQLRPGTALRLFELGKEVGIAKAQKVEADGDLCPDLQVITFEKRPERGVIAVDAPWKALPRPVNLMNPTQEVYGQAVRDFLADRGMRKAEAKITQIIRSDLDGDGEEEVLLSATNYDAEKDSAPTGARPGDYSFVLLRQLRDGKVETKLIDGEFYKKNETFSAPNVHRVAAILDLDGDGKMELVLTSNYYEGGMTTVYRYTPASIKKLVSVSCGA